MVATRAQAICAGLLAGLTTLGMSRPRVVPPTVAPAILFSTITNEQRVQAMVSVHGHANFPDADQNPFFIDIDEAVSILKQDTAPGADSRRRRAMAELAAHDYGRFHLQIAQLVHDLDMIGAIEAYLLAVAGGPIPATVFQKFAGIYNIGFGLTDCKDLALVLDGSGIGIPPPITWNYEFLVKRDLSDLARSLDPQSWSECSLIFQKSYLADVDASCCPHSKGANCTYSKYSPSDDPPEEPSQPRGKPYGSTPLFEELCYDRDGDCGGNPSTTVSDGDCETNADCDVGYENTLCVQTWYTPPIPNSSLLSMATRYDVDYHFGDAVYAEVDGRPASDYRPTVDQGSLFVRGSTAADKTRVAPADQPKVSSGLWSFTHVDKTLDLEKSFGEDAIGEMLRAFAQELGDHIIDQMCCVIPAEAWPRPVRLPRVPRRLPQHRFNPYALGLVPH